MNFIERIIYIVIILFLIITASTRKPGFHVIEVPGDKIIDTVKIPYDSLIYNIDTIYNTDTLWLHDTTFLPTDTVAILADYFNMVSYDSILLRNDSSITNWVRLNITQNRLYDITGYSLNNRKQVIISEDDNSLNIGGLVGNKLFAPTISYQYKQHNIGVGYNVVNNGFLLKYEYKLNKKW
jgi:hypothetical protein